MKGWKKMWGMSVSAAPLKKENVRLNSVNSKNITSL